MFTKLRFGSCSALKLANLEVLIVVEIKPQFELQIILENKHSNPTYQHTTWTVKRFKADQNFCSYDWLGADPREAIAPLKTKKVTLFIMLHHDFVQLGKQYLWL